MQFSFEKYHGAGNDFILIDNTKGSFHGDQKTIAKLCHRHFGIGADGLILLQSHPDFDFEMIYYNADGNIGSMCGNGGRCAVIFANKLNMIKDEGVFLATDGVHHAKIDEGGEVNLSMNPVHAIAKVENAFVMNTGSPHYVTFVDSVNELDVISEGKKIRNNDTYRAEGINVNFAKITDAGILMRTYERGVEDETFSCGTGTIAAAIAASVKLDDHKKEQSVFVQALGGDLTVSFTRESADHFTNVFLKGPVGFVFAGTAEM
jgi:diaminopimelate epimerase